MIRMPTKRTLNSQKRPGVFIVRARAEGIIWATKPFAFDQRLVLRDLHPLRNWGLGELELDPESVALTPGLVEE